MSQQAEAHDRFVWLRKPKYWFVLFLIGLAAYRSTLVDRGHFFWGDEQRYLSAVALVDDVFAGNYREGTSHLNECHARPGFVLLSTVPVLLQRAASMLLNISYGTPRSYDIAATFNVAVSLVVSCLVFAIARIWLRCDWYALLAAVVYSLLTGANVWVRHLMPYQMALLLFLIPLWILTKTDPQRGPSVRLALVVGILSSVGYATYPSFYFFVVINAATLITLARRRWFMGWLMFIAILLGIGLFEMLARLGGKSYIHEILAVVIEHSAQIDQGWFPEGYVFVERYLREVEGPAGVALLILFLWFVFAVLFRRGVTLPVSARVTIITAIAGYLVHASLSVLWHKSVFFGRLLGMYLPFIVCGAALAIRSMRPSWTRRVCVASLLMASVSSFSTFAAGYAQVIYPADFLFETLTARGVTVQFPPQVLWGKPGGRADSVEELDDHVAMVMDARPEGTESQALHLHSHAEAVEGWAQYIGVNLKWVFYYRKQDARFVPSDEYRLIAEAPYPSWVPAIGYEAYKPWERRRLLQRDYSMRIYERVDVEQTHAATASGRSAVPAG